MSLLTTLPRSVSAVLLLVLCLPACIIVVEDDITDDYLHRHRWRLDVIVYAGRTYTADEGYTIRFQAGGDLLGRADCNNYDGSYETPRNGVLYVREIYSEADLCSRHSLDDQYFEVLSEAVSYRARHDELIITARTGDKLYFYKD